MSYEVSFCQCGRWRYEIDENGNRESYGNCELCDKTRNDDGTIKLRNGNVKETANDVLFHLGLGNFTHDLVEMFGDVKFVCMGVSPSEMRNFASFIMRKIDFKLPAGIGLSNISIETYGYSLYKIGPVISVNHGMGFSSISIILNEITKLMYHSKCKDPIFIRFGRSEGIGIDPGTVVVSNGCLNSCLRDFYETRRLGKIQKLSIRVDQNLAEEFLRSSNSSNSNLGFNVVLGKTVAMADFYEECRSEGAFWKISETETVNYLEKFKDVGVKNIDSESVPFFAYTHHAGIRAANVCVTLVDRLRRNEENVLQRSVEFGNYPHELVARFIQNKLETI